MIRFNDQVQSTMIGDEEVMSVKQGDNFIYSSQNPPVDAEFKYRRTPNNKFANLTQVDGKSFKWNQMVSQMTGDPATNIGLTASVGSDGGLTISGSPSTTPSYNQLPITNVVSFLDGHKYYLFLNKLPNITWGVTGYGVNRATISTVFNTTPGTSWNGYIALKATEGVVISVTDLHANVIDLTAAEYPNIATTTPTVEEVEAWIAENIGELPYYPYDEGSVKNNCLEAVETVGFNLWDEEWEVGEIDSQTGQNTYALNVMRSKNYIPVFGGQNYYYLAPQDSEQNSRMRFYDSDKNYIGYAWQITRSGIFTPPTNCAYMRFRITENTPTYNHDICINASDTSKNGTYLPYDKHTLPVDVKHIYGKLNGTGALTQVWPTGVPGNIGDLKDVLKIEKGQVVADRVIGEIDMGTPNYEKYSVTEGSLFRITLVDRKSGLIKCICSKYICVPYTKRTDKTISGNVKYADIIDNSFSESTTTQFKIAMSGVMLYYELDTPQHYTDLVYQGSSYYADGTPVTLPEDYHDLAWHVLDTLPQNTTSAVVTTVPPLTWKKYENTLGLAQLTGVKGKSLVWNQMVQIPSESISKTIDNVTYTDNRNGTYTVQTTAEGASANTSTASLAGTIGTLISGHKYLVKGCPTGGSDTTYRLRFTSGNKSEVGAGLIFTNSGSVSFLQCQVLSGTIITTPITFRPILIDLTKMFGSGNEPSTVEEFEAMFPLPYYDYNAGEIISNKTTTIEAVGFNQWDEEWEGGSINPTTGENSVNANKIRSKNFIPVFPSTDYYFCAPKVNDSDHIIFYDANKQRMSYFGLYSGQGSSAFTTPANCVYIRFNFYSTTYNNDICINLSDPTKNETYEPYKKSTVNLNLTTLTGKLNGEGTSKIVLPSGAKSDLSRTIYDYGIVENGYLTKIMKVMDEVDLGDLSWGNYGSYGTTSYPYGFATGTLNTKKPGNINFINSKYEVKQSWNFDKVLRGDGGNNKIYIIDSSFENKTGTQVATALNGVKCVYELATPELYILDNPVCVEYLSNPSGTERRLPDDTASAVSTEFVGSIKYPRYHSTN